MRLLFVHQNFPGQYRHLARHYGNQAGHEVLALTHAGNAQAELIRTARYPFEGEKVSVEGAPLGRHYAQAAARGEAAARAALALDRDGFKPDVILGHCGWGETLFLKEVWPDARLQAYCEFFYRTRGADVGFDPEFQDADLGARASTHSKNAAMLLGLMGADRGIAPTQWQCSVFPHELHGRIDVAHDGIDTGAVRPDPSAFIRLERQGLTLRPGDEVVTFVNRNLEPYRGYHRFMRALPAILKARPKAHAVIIGGDGVSYGRPAPAGRTWKEVFLREVGERLDMDRVHFVGKVPYPVYLNVLQVSAAHVYLTYPFVLSWSLLEAMAAQCLVIASDTPPVAEAVEDGKTGLLFDFLDHERLAELVIRALERPKAFRAIRQAARRHIVERYDLKTRCLPRQIELIDVLRR